MASVFICIYKYPDSYINPFPPPTQAEVVEVPSLTPSMVALPDIWTPVPTMEETLLSSDQDYQIEATSTKRAVTNTPVIIFPTKSAEDLKKDNLQQYAPGIMLPTKNPLESINEEDSEEKFLTITAPIGVFNNVWQNIQSIPSFSWSMAKSSQKVDHFLLYFGANQNGYLSTETDKLQYNRPAVPSGIYYFRLIAIARDGTTIGSPSTFLFKFDDTRPTDPTNFLTTSSKDTNLPFFTWSESVDVHSGMIGGLAGYSIYQGTSNKCGKPVAFTTVPHWSPVTPLAIGTTEYFCVRAMDAIGNESNWVGPVPFSYAN
jgi:hypothetical protein